MTTFLQKWTFLEKISKMSFLQKLVLYPDTKQQTKFKSKIRKYEYMGMHWTLAGHDLKNVKNQKNFGNLTFMLLCRNWAKKQFLMSLHGFSMVQGTHLTTVVRYCCLLSEVECQVGVGRYMVSYLMVMCKFGKGNTGAVEITRVNSLCHMRVKELGCVNSILLCPGVQNSRL